MWVKLFGLRVSGLIDMTTLTRLLEVLIHARYRNASSRDIPRLTRVLAV